MTEKVPSRKRARRDAAFVLYQHDLTGLAPAKLLADLEVSEGYRPDPFTVHAVDGVLAARARLDAQIEAHCEHWHVERLAPLERNLLRLALFEMESGETPPEVAIDEAVRLAKRYSTGEAGALVNGVLGSALEEQRAGSPAADDAAGTAT